MAKKSLIPNKDVYTLNMNSTLSLCWWVCCSWKVLHTKALKYIYIYTDYIQNLEFCELMYMEDGRWLFYLCFIAL